MTQHPDTPTPDTQLPSAPETSTWRKIMWFIALWCGGVLAIGTVGLIIKLVIKLQFPDA